MECYIMETCNSCSGAGYKIAGVWSVNSGVTSKTCKACNGHGFILIPQTVPDSVVIGRNYFTAFESEE